MNSPPRPEGLTPAAFRARLLVLLGVSLAAGAAALLAPRLAQPQWYHDFADSRTLLHVPNALNVLSKLTAARGQHKKLAGAAPAG